MVASNEVLPNPFVSAETLLAFTLIGLHLLAGGDAGSSGGQSPEQGYLWWYSCSESPDWDGDVESWTDSEGTSSSEQCEHNVESLALHALRQDQSGEAATWPWTCCARKCTRLGCWVAATKRPVVKARNASSQSKDRLRQRRGTC